MGFLLAAGLHASVSIASDVHDFHYSRLGLQWNAETSTWQGILRVFTDDLEAALSYERSEDITWRLGDEKEHPQAHAAKFGGVVEAATGCVPEVPDTLLGCLDKPKESTLLPPEYGAFRSYLLQA